MPAEFDLLRSSDLCGTIFGFGPDLKIIINGRQYMGLPGSLFCQAIRFPRIFNPLSIPSSTAISGSVAHSSNPKCLKSFRLGSLCAKINPSDALQIILGCISIFKHGHIKFRPHICVYELLSMAFAGRAFLKF
jgi:hypothetical protein